MRRLETRDMESNGTQNPFKLFSAVHLAATASQSCLHVSLRRIVDDYEMHNVCVPQLKQLLLSRIAG